MAFNLEDVYKFGTGSIGEITNPSGQVNSYANVTAYTPNSITIGAAGNGIYEKFEKDKHIMIHISATNNQIVDVDYLGNWVVAQILSVSGTILTIDKDFTKILPPAEFSKYLVQAITFANFTTITLVNSAIIVPPFSIAAKYGGICLIKCKDKLILNGGSINLTDKGIPIANTTYRPWLAQENQGKADTDKYSAWENHVTKDRFLLNCGDGACMVVAKSIDVQNTNSRIGGTQAGTQFSRVNNIGASTIALISEEINNFNCNIISKQKKSGQGLGRCYIASHTKLRNDEGLYAYDCVSDKNRLYKKLNIHNYGDGSLGDVTNPTLALNNYARVTGISIDGKTIAYTAKTLNGMAQISQGSTIMFHVSKHVDSNDMNLLGKFVLAKVLSDDGNNIVVDTSVTNIFDTTKLSKYNCQIISLAQFNNLTINTNYTATAAWNDSAKIGGICAIAAKGICNIENGQINVGSKSGGSAYAREGLAFIGNAQNNDLLPLGQGAGSVFLLVKDLKANDASRIGSKFTGNRCGGNATWNNGNSQDIHGTEGGYIGAPGVINNEPGGGDKGYRNDYNNRGGYGGENGLLGTMSYNVKGLTGESGAHLFMIIGKLNRLTLSFIATGGYIPNASNIPGVQCFETNCGGAGYGSGGTGYASGAGYSAGGGGRYVTGSSGGAAGWAFIYVNEIKEFDMTGVII